MASLAGASMSSAISRVSVMQSRDVVGDIAGERDGGNVRDRLRKRERLRSSLTDSSSTWRGALAPLRLIGAAPRQ